MFKKISDGTLPPSAGWYTTNFGELYFNGEVFLMSGHRQPTPTTVEFWMMELVATKPEFED